MTYDVLPAESGDGDGVAGRAAERLREGGILVHPTSTVYGLGGRARPETDRELARIKGREPGRPFIRLAADVAAVRRLRPAAVWDARADRLARALWPGPLTLVLEDGTPEGLAVRVDGHPLARAVPRELGDLMSSTSVNRSGEPPARGPDAVRRALEALPESRVRVTFLDAGELPPSPPSTVVSLREPTPRIVREGAVPAGRVFACLGEGCG